MWAQSCMTTIISQNSTFWKAMWWNCCIGRTTSQKPSQTAYFWTVCTKVIHVLVFMFLFSNFRHPKISLNCSIPGWQRLFHSLRSAQPKALLMVVSLGKQFWRNLSCTHESIKICMFCVLSLSWVFFFWVKQNVMSLMCRVRFLGHGRHQGMSFQ